MLICTPYITVKGKRIYAHKKGLRAFCFNVTEEEHKKYCKKKIKQKTKKIKNKIEVVAPFGLNEPSTKRQG